MFMDTLTAQTFAHLADGVESLLTATALLVAAAWTYRRFVKRREEHARLAFDPTIRFVTELDDVWMIEVVAAIENKGEVRHVIKEIKYELELCDVAPTGLLTSTGSIASILMSQKVEARSWLPDGVEYIFVEPAVKSEFCACAAIPKSTRLICLRGYFSSGERREFFFGERLFALPKPSSLTQASVPPWSVQDAGTSSSSGRGQLSGFGP
jgi:hypothetical protein